MHAALNPQPDWLDQRLDATVASPADLYRWSGHDPEIATERGRVHALRSDADALLHTRVEGRGGTTYRSRREVEDAVADVLEGHYLLPEVVRKLRLCRRSGTWGYAANRPDKAMVMWDHKCGHGRLCPDEIRTEGRRLTRIYKPAILDWKRAGFGRRVQYAVFTQPNVPEGKLAEFKRFQFKVFSEWLKLFPMVKGALAVQEDPLSRLGGWHVHLNALLLIEGYNEWADFRAAWTKLAKPFFPGCNVPTYNIEFIPMPHTAAGLDSALRELIKYPIKFVASRKDHEHGSGGSARACDGARAGAGGLGEQGAAGVDGGVGVHGDGRTLCDEGEGAQSAAGPEGEGDGGGSDLAGDDPGKRAHLHAPAFTEWSESEVGEWYHAGVGFRRSRSYGALFNLHALHWNRLLTKAARARLLAQLGADTALAAYRWLKLPKEVREALKPILIPDDEPLGEIVVVGRVSWSCEHRCYLVYRPTVEFIPGDKSISTTGPPRVSSGQSLSTGQPPTFPREFSSSH